MIATTRLSPARRTALLCALVLLLALGGCTLPGQQGGAEESQGLNPTRTPNFSRADGTFNERKGPTPTALADDEVPPSLIIEELVPFTHEGTGISGLRPKNWKLFSGDDSFQISSSPEAPDGFIGALVPEQELPEGSQEEQIAAMMKQMLEQKKTGQKLEVVEQTTEDDGSATLLASMSGNAQGSSKIFSFMMYLRLSPTPKGILMSMAQVPAELYPEEADLVKEMVDSLKVE